jgi:lipopolysaccharide transport system ATP-binding protein
LNKPVQSEVLIFCNRISKKFCRNLKKSLWYGVKDGVDEIVRGQSSDTLRKDEFWALENVSFELRRGQCLGLLGRNGAGKTTLLKVLSGLIKPDKGKITLKGKVGGLIALGAGFNGILSGRENIRINGAILGYSRDEIENRMNQIIDFAEIHDFIDAPVNTYSSGMSVRLGFAIAVILIKPDVLLLDEVLAVGDIGFTIKCLNAVREIMKNSAVIFVSHNMQFVSRFCTQTILFDKGKMIGAFDTSEGIQHYMNRFPQEEIKLVSKKIEISECELIDQNGNLIEEINKTFQIKHADKISLKFNINSTEKITVYFSLEIQDAFKTPIISYTIDKKEINTGPAFVHIPLNKIKLNTGNYSIIVAVRDMNTDEVLIRIENVCPFQVINEKILWGKVIEKTNLILVSRK